MAASTVEFAATPNGFVALFSPFGPLPPSPSLLEGELHAAANEPIAAVAMAPRRSVRLSRELSTNGHLCILTDRLALYGCAACAPAVAGPVLRRPHGGVVAVVSEPRCGAGDQLSDAGTEVAGATAEVALRLIRSQWPTPERDPMLKSSPSPGLRR